MPDDARGQRLRRGCVPREQAAERVLVSIAEALEQISVACLGDVRHPHRHAPGQHRRAPQPRRPYGFGAWIHASRRGVFAAHQLSDDPTAGCSREPATGGFQDLGQRRRLLGFVEGAARRTGTAMSASSREVLCTAMASTNRDSTRVSAPDGVAGEQHGERVRGDARRHVGIAHGLEQHLGGLPGHGRRLLRARSAWPRPTLESNEQEHDGRPCAVGHAQMVIGDGREPAKVGQARELIGGREVASQPPLGDRVAHRAREQPGRDGPANEVILGATVQRDGAVGLPIGVGHDQDRRLGGAGAERAEELQRCLIAQRHDDRIDRALAVESFEVLRVAPPRRRRRTRVPRRGPWSSPTSTTLTMSIGLPSWSVDGLSHPRWPQGCAWGRHRSATGTPPSRAGSGPARAGRLAA